MAGEALATDNNQSINTSAGLHTDSGSRNTNSHRRKT